MTTFPNAMEAWKDDVYNRLWPHIQDLDGFLDRKPMCHRTCMSRCTHKREVEVQAAKSSRFQDQSDLLINFGLYLQINLVLVLLIGITKSQQSYRIKVYWLTYKDIKRKQLTW
jgi:hypothetical protein